MNNMVPILKKVIQHLEERYDKEIGALVTALSQARDGDTIPLDLKANEEMSVAERAKLAEAGVTLEERLFRHVDYYLSDIKKKKELMVMLMESIGTYRRIPIVYEGMSNSEYEGAVDAILLFSPFWIRDPLHWDKSSNVSIVEHLFVEYPMPDMFYREWYKPWKKINKKWLVWFISLSQGGSLKKASGWFPWKVYSRFQHFYLELGQQFSNAAVKVSLADLCMGAEINRLGGSGRHMTLFRQNTTYRIDPTETDKYSKDFIQFWYQTVHWFINNGECINDNQYQAILQWAIHQHIEAKNEALSFSWKGRAPGNVIQASADYLQKLETPGEDYQWDYHKLDWKFQDKEKKLWTVSEITSGKELSLEGKQLMHCAGEYAERCRTGRSVLFSLKCNQERTATIELDGALKKIVQAKGYKNRRLNLKEKGILYLWFRHAVSSKLEADSIKPENKLQDIMEKYRFKDYHTINSDGNYILHQAAEEGNIGDLLFILDTGFEIDLANDRGKTALMISVKNRDREMVSELIEKGADVNVARCPRVNALAIAIDQEDVGIIRLLMQVKVKVWPHHIIQALKKTTPCIIKLLKNMGADLDASTWQNKTALSMAIGYDDPGLINKLLNTGVNIDLQSY